MKLLSQWLLALPGAAFHGWPPAREAVRLRRQPPPSLSRVSPSVWSKSIVNLRAGVTQALTATVTGSANQGVTWAIEKRVLDVAPSDWIWERSATTNPNPDFPS